MQVDIFIDGGKIKTHLLLFFFMFGIVSLFCQESNREGKMVVIFVHPSTIFSIPGERLLPAIQNVQLGGLHEVLPEVLDKDSYEKVFLPFVKNYQKYFSDSVSYYMFNWGGAIYPIKHKQQASSKFYHALKKYHKEQKPDKIVLIGCSHGGTVILGMADFLKQDSIPIDVAVLLGTPISFENEEYATMKRNDGSFVFETIINVYSDVDYIQKLDVFFNNFHFCKRKISPQSNIINYRITDYGHINLWHRYVWKDPFVLEVPRLLKKLLG